MAGGVLGSIAGAVLGPGVSAALPSITDTVKILVDRFVPDPTQKAAAEQEMARIISAREAAVAEMVTKQNEGQASINLAEATGNDRYSSRWRPSVGWICVGGLGYQFLVSPMLGWIMGVIGTLTGLPFPMPPTVPTGDLLYLLLGILGLGGLRTYERTTGVPGALPPKV